MAILTKKKKMIDSSSITVKKTVDSPVLYSSVVQYFNYMYKNDVSNSNEKNDDSFKAEVKKIMQTNGADENYINKYLTDTAILNAINNGCTAEDLAWVLLH